MDHVPLLQEFEMAQPGRREDRAWRMMVICILLNQTRGKQVRKVLDDLFALVGSPAGMVVACNPINSVHHGRLRAVLEPLGLVNRRIVMLGEFSRAWIHFGGDRDISLGSEADKAVEDLRLPGVGEYARDAWGILVREMLPVEAPRDKELSRLLDECMEMSAAWHGSWVMADADLRRALAQRRDGIRMGVAA